MSRKKALTPEALEALGPAKLASLLMDLAAAEGPEAVARQVRKRFSALRRSARFLDWHQTRPLARELDEPTHVITDDIAPAAPGIAPGALAETKSPEYQPVGLSLLVRAPKRSVKKKRSF